MSPTPNRAETQVRSQAPAEGTTYREASSQAVESPKRGRGEGPQGGPREAHLRRLALGPATLAECRDGSRGSPRPHSAIQQGSRECAAQQQRLWSPRSGGLGPGLHRVPGHVRTQAQVVSLHTCTRPASAHLSFTWFCAPGAPLLAPSPPAPPPLGLLHSTSVRSSRTAVSLGSSRSNSLAKRMKWT